MADPNARRVEILRTLFLAFVGDPRPQRIEAYVQHTQSLDLRDLSEACVRLVESEERMPSIAKVRGAAFALRARRQQGDGEVDEGALSAAATRSLIEERMEGYAHRVPITEGNVRLHWLQFGRQLRWPPYTSPHGTVEPYPPEVQPLTEAQQSSAQAWIDHARDRRLRMERGEPAAKPKRAQGLAPIGDTVDAALSDSHRALEELGW